jgi:ABC-type multidrug transport system ATPase subunit
MIGPSGSGKTTLLSCILGMDHLDEGIIRVLGHDSDQIKTLQASRRIGYMPQEVALVGEMTVKETVYYFGNIFEMEHKRIDERYQMLRDLLKLPPDDFRVENCSGGEQRRVSFAAAIIHEPDLLILDEPTVGLDPLLRERIWDFLRNITRTTKLSVIITTHYIEEAQKADNVGLMRGGILLAEDSPKNVMNRTGTERLDDAFLAFCVNTVQPVAVSTVESDFENCEEITSDRKIFRWQILSMIFNRHFVKYKRQPA